MAGFALAVFIYFIGNRSFISHRKLPVQVIIFLVFQTKKILSNTGRLALLKSHTNKKLLRYPVDRPNVRLTCS